MAQHAQLTVTQWEAIELLADLISKPSVQQVAVAVGVDDATLYRWLSKPEFAQELRLRKQAIFVELDAFKLMGVYDNELNKNNPGSRVMEQIAKTLGFFSDGSDISLNIQVDNGSQSFAGIQSDIDT